MPPALLGTINIYEKNSTYTIFDTDDGTHLFTIRLTSRFRSSHDRHPCLRRATCHAIKKFRVSKASNIALVFPSSGTISPNKEGGFFSNDKRTMRSAALGQVYWSGRQVNTPWKGGRSETSFMKLADAGGKALVEYKDEGHALKRMGVYRDWCRAEAGRVG